VWLVDGRDRRISTRDLVGMGALTVLTGVSGTAWTAAAMRCRDEWDLPVRAVVIGGADARDAYGDWHRTVADELDEAGCLLVRPDGYVAWRACAAPSGPEAAYGELRAALLTMLGRADDDLAGVGAPDKVTADEVTAGD
jgi:2,4-dichlorophenol 6-monooxygenase